MTNKEIQEWLTLHGFKVAIDGDFGPATRFALKQFQTKAGFENNGSVDEATATALLAPMQRACAEITGITSFGDLVVAYAKQHLAERPREVGGENRGPWVRYYTGGHEGDSWAWCAGFVSTILKQAAKTLSVPVPITPSLSCDELARDAMKRGLLTGPAGLGPGAIFLNRKSLGDWVHTGIVIAFHEDCAETIEGNTNDEGSREGYEVCQRIRSFKDKDFIKL